MNLRERLTKVAEDAIKEGVESSKDIISNNVVSSFEDMGMANVEPGEFAQGEITDKQNLVNQGSMSNDTDFNKEGEHPVEKALDTAEKMLDDLVDISAPKADATLEIVKTTGECDNAHGPDCDCPACWHKHHEEHLGEAAELKEEDTPLYLQNPQLAGLYNDWKNKLADPQLTLATMPGTPNPVVVQDMVDDGIDLQRASVGDYVCHEINNVADRFSNMPKAWNSMIDQLVYDAKTNPNIDLSPDNEAWLPELKLAEQPVNYGESVMGKIISKTLGGKSCEQYLKEAVVLKESDFAGPKDFTPDIRLNFAEVLNALKQEIGEGSEGIHVDVEVDDRKNNCYKVSQIDKEKLPKTLKVNTTELKLDGDTYYMTGATDEYPLNK